MDRHSLKSNDELLKQFIKMRKWSKPTYEQMMEYLEIYSELTIRGAISD
jgi:hypothetical protein